jgi:hypothetical protein
MKLSQRDRRALKIGVISVAAILAFTFGITWLGHWSGVRKSIAAKKATLRSIQVNKNEQGRLMSMVPVFEMPQDEEKQKFLFREKFHEQLKKVGFKGEPIRVLRAKKVQAGTGYRLLGLQTRGKCKFEQMLDLLTNLNENPYLVGIEELMMECDPKKRREFKLDLTVSTFVK